MRRMAPARCCGAVFMEVLGVGTCECSIGVGRVSNHPQFLVVVEKWGGFFFALCTFLEVDEILQTWVIPSWLRADVWL